MHMRHALPRFDPVLNRNVQTTRAVDALDHPPHAPDSEEEVAGFGGCEVGNAGGDAARGDEDVAREDGFEVYKGVGEAGEVEDLAFCISYLYVKVEGA